jgi:hypothetical protein
MPQKLVHVLASENKNENYHDAKDEMKALHGLAIADWSVTTGAIETKGGNCKSAISNRQCVCLDQSFRFS